jgi:hypothetical protein
MILGQIGEPIARGRGTEAERTAYAPLRGAERGPFASALRMRANRDRTDTQEMESSGMVIRAMFGGLA